MGIRETINERPKPMLVAATLIILSIAVFMMYGTREAHFEPPKYAFFSVDDGKTFFKDDATKVAPFDAGGQQAVAAYVYVGADGKPFVGYLERAMNPDARTFVESARRKLFAEAAGQAMGAADRDLLDQITHHLEVKRPGDKDWINAASPKASPIGRTTCPDGSVPTPVAP